MSEKLIELLRKRVKQTREWQQSETMTAALSDLDLAEIAVVERLDALESSLAQAQADVEALQKKSLRLQAALYDALTMRLFPGDIEVQDIVLDHDEGLAEIEAALPEHLRGSK